MQVDKTNPIVSTMGFRHGLLARLARKGYCDWKEVKQSAQELRFYFKTSHIDLSLVLVKTEQAALVVL